MLPELEKIADLVIHHSRTELLPRFAAVIRSHKLDGSIVTEADIAMQSVIEDDLAELWPEFELLGEEMKESEQQRLWENQGKGIWVLDPLDGTSNFANGIPFFSVSLALMIDRQAVLGVVFDPIRDECFTTRLGDGAWLNGMPLVAEVPHIPLPHSIGVVDFKRLPNPLAARLGTDPPYGSQRNFGSSALDWCWLAANRYQVYVHGGQKLWDFAGGGLVLEEAGGKSLTLEGEPVCGAGTQSRSVVAALDNRLFDDWWAWINANEDTGTR